MQRGHALRGRVLPPGESWPSGERVGGDLRPWGDDEFGHHPRRGNRGRHRRGGNATGRRRRRLPAPGQRPPVRVDRRHRLPQARGPAAGPVLQAARRLQPDGPARPRPSGRPASSAPAPATTPRGWRSPAGARDQRRGSTCRARRRGRSATGSRRSAATWSSLMLVGDTYDEAADAAAADAARTGAILVPAVRRPADDRRPGHDRRRDRRAAWPRPGRASSCRSAAAACWPASSPGWASGTPRCGSSASSRPVRPSMTAGARRGRPGAAGGAGHVRRRRRGAPGRRPHLPVVDRRGCRRRAAVTVDEGAVCTEMLALYQTDGIIAEPAGALARPRALRTPSAWTARARPSSASSPAATTTSAATPRSSSGRWCTRASSTTSWSTSRRNPGALRRFLDEVLGPGRRHHPVRVRQAQQPGDRPGPGRHRARPLEPLPGLLERMDALTDADRADRPGIAGLPLSDLTRI